MKANTEQNVAGNLSFGPGLIEQRAEQIYEQDKDGDWAEFCKKLKRLIRDAIRLQKRMAELDEMIYLRQCDNAKEQF